MEWDLAQFWHTLNTDGPDLWLRLSQHLGMTLAAVCVASVIGFTLALAVRDNPRISVLLLNFCNTLQTVPSLALLALLLPLFGIGAKPAIAALILYALQPIVRNTLTAIRDCPGELVDAGYSMGLTSSQILWNIQLPQGLPLLIAGLRTATVWSVGTATLGAFIMAGGLGEFINRGISMNNYTLVLLGAMPAAALAIGLDSLLGVVESAAQRWKNGFPISESKSKAPAVGVAAAVVIVLLLTIVPAVLASSRDVRTVRVGCKNFAEQRLLGELLAQRIEEKLHVPVKREFGFGSTQLLHSAFVRGEIDVYVEYTGTAEQTILKLPPAPVGEGNQSVANDQEVIRKLYDEKFGALWLKSLGFSNTYTVICRRDSAGAKYKTLSQLAPDTRRFAVAMNSEFVGRADGYPALKKRYGFDFGNESSVDIGFIYPALDEKQVEFAVAFYTDARLSGAKYTVVEDDLHVFPRYDACPVMRKETAARLPELQPLLLGMAGTIDAPTMRELNKKVELDGKTPRDVAAGFWASRDHGAGAGAGTAN